MNKAASIYADENFDYSVDERKQNQRSRKSSSKSRSPSYRSKGKSAQSFNGIHRRRKKRINW